MYGPHTDQFGLGEVEHILQRVVHLGRLLVSVGAAVPPPSTREEALMLKQIPGWPDDSLYEGLPPEDGPATDRHEDETGGPSNHRLLPAREKVKREGRTYYRTSGGRLRRWTMGEKVG